MHVVASLLTLQLGWGLWFFPWVFARLGWATACAVLAALASLFAASGMLFTALFQATPGVVVFGDIGAHAAGFAGRAAVCAVVYSVQAAEPIVLHLAVAESLRHAFPEGGTPGVWRAGALVFMAASLLVQIRSLSELAWLFVAGNVAVLSSAAIVASDLIARRDPDAHHAVQAVTARSLFPDGVLAIIDITFAYGGQVGYVEVLSSMERPERFPHAVAGASLAATLLYAALGAVGYWSRGDAVGTIVVFDLQRNAQARAASALLFACALMQYVLTINIWAHTVLVLLTRCRNRHREAAAQRARQQGEGERQQQQQRQQQQSTADSRQQQQQQQQPAPDSQQQQQQRQQQQQPQQQPQQDRQLANIRCSSRHGCNGGAGGCATASDVELGGRVQDGAVDDRGRSSCGSQDLTVAETPPTRQPLPAAVPPALSLAPTVVQPTDHSRAAWAAATASIALYSLLISSSLPFLSSLVDLLTSATSLLIAFVLPAWFLLRLQGRGMALAGRAGLWGLGLLAMAVSVAGLAASIATFGRSD